MFENIDFYSFVSLTIFSQNGLRDTWAKDENVLIYQTSIYYLFFIFTVATYISYTHLYFMVCLLSVINVEQ